MPFSNVLMRCAYGAPDAATSNFCESNLFHVFIIGNCLNRNKKYLIRKYDRIYKSSVGMIPKFWPIPILKKG